MRWLSLPLSCDVDAVEALGAVHAWGGALDLSTAARAQACSLVDALVREGVPDERAGGSPGSRVPLVSLGWDERARPCCELEHPAAVRVAALADAAALHPLALALGDDEGRPRVRLTAALPSSSVERAAIERALGDAVPSPGALRLARACAALRDREDELRAALDAAAEESRKKDELLAVAAHDIRSPVAAAKGALELVEPTLEGLSDDQRHLFGVARRGCDAVVHLAGNLLVSALVDADASAGPGSAAEDDALEPSIDLRAPTREVVDLATIEARRKDVQIELDAPEGEVPVRADPMWARQIVANLVHNAVKYAARGGHVWVRLRHEDGRARFSVEDDGVGIPLAKADRVFARLAKIRPRGTAGERGSGIGLWIAQRLVARLGGTIAFAPRAPQGTRFEVELPAAAPPRGALTAPTTTV